MREVSARPSKEPRHESAQMPQIGVSGRLCGIARLSAGRLARRGACAPYPTPPARCPCHFPAQNRPIRRLLPVLAAAALLAAVAPTRAASPSPAAGEIVQCTNAARVGNGLAPLEVD